MRKFLIAVIFGLAFVTSAQAQVNPRLVGDKDVFKMEDEAIERWKAVLPRLSQDWSDYQRAWKRLKDRLDVTGGKWIASSNSADENDKKKLEMWRWCALFLAGDSPETTGKAWKDQAALRFGRLEVRATVCEDTPLPTATETKK